MLEEIVNFQTGAKMRIRKDKSQTRKCKRERCWVTFPNCTLFFIYLLINVNESGILHYLWSADL